jgi:spore coat protein U-like protein
MKIDFKQGCVIAVLGLGLIPLSSSLAVGPITVPMTVTATLIGTCTLTVKPLNFGTTIIVPATVSQTVNGDAVTQSLTCDQARAYHLKADTGANYLAPNRRMKTGSSYIPYQLYTSTTPTTIWGDGTIPSGSATQLVTVATAGTPVLYDYNGVMDASALVTPIYGTAYTDTVNVSVLP